MWTPFSSSEGVVLRGAFVGLGGGLEGEGNAVVVSPVSDIAMTEDFGSEPEGVVGRCPVPLAEEDDVVGVVRPGDPPGCVVLGPPPAVTELGGLVEAANLD